MSEPTLFEKSQAGRQAVALDGSDVPAQNLPDELVRKDNGMPELSQLDVIRHFLRLSQAIESKLYLYIGKHYKHRRDCAGHSGLQPQHRATIERRHYGVGST